METHKIHWERGPSSFPCLFMLPLYCIVSVPLPTVHPSFLSLNSSFACPHATTSGQAHPAVRALLLFPPHPPFFLIFLQSLFCLPALSHHLALVTLSLFPLPCPFYLFCHTSTFLLLLLAYKQPLKQWPRLCNQKIWNFSPYKLTFLKY